MLGRWKDQLRNDPYYSVNLTLDREDFSVAVAARRGAPPHLERAAGLARATEDA
jgi:hypothetical protein